MEKDRYYRPPTDEENINSATEAIKDWKIAKNLDDIKHFKSIENPVSKSSFKDDIIHTINKTSNRDYGSFDGESAREVAFLQQSINMSTIRKKFEELCHFQQSSMDNVVANLIFEGSILSEDRDLLVSQKKNVCIESSPLSLDLVIRDVGVFPISYKNGTFAISDCDYNDFSENALEEVHEVIEKVTFLVNKSLKKQIEDISSMVKYVEKEKGNFIKKVGSSFALSTNKKIPFSGRTQPFLKSYNYDHESSSLTSDPDILLHYHFKPELGFGRDIDIRINNKTGKYEVSSLADTDLESIFFINSNGTTTKVDSSSDLYKNIQNAVLDRKSIFLKPEIKKHVITTSQHVEFQLKGEIFQEFYDKKYISLAKEFRTCLEKVQTNIWNFSPEKFQNIDNKTLLPKTQIPGGR